MLTRREFAGFLAAEIANAAPEFPKLRVVQVSRNAALPQHVSAACVQFSRAYAACPEARARQQSLLTGRFPHSRASLPLVQLVPNGTPQVATLFISEPVSDAPSDPSARITLALTHPRIRGGQWADFPVSTVDIAPTLYGLERVPRPGDMHGRDLAELLTNNGQGARPESIFAEGGLETADEWRMVVRGMDKIVVRPNLDVLQLFNLADDPHEERNLAREIGYQLRVDELRAIVRDWMKRTGDGQDPSGLKRR